MLFGHRLVKGNGGAWGETAADGSGRKKNSRREGKEKE